MNNLRGALLMVLSMGGFALEDMIIKYTAATLPLGQILLFIGLGGSLLFAGVTFFQRQKLFPRELLNPALITRNLCEVIGTGGFATALALIPISTATAIQQSVPLLVTMGAAMFLGETVGWRRWTAILVGFAGMLLIIRPGAAGFEPASLFAVLGAVGLAARDVVTPRIPRTMTGLQVATWGFVSMIPLGAVMLAFTGGAMPFSTGQLAMLSAAVALGVTCYYMLVQSVRIADLSAIAPFRYSRLLFALIIGLVVFAERPDLPTLAGAGLIIGSGLYTLARERALFSKARRR